jgi:hypothetical protein
MGATEPGERGNPGPGGAKGRLERPPSDRYTKTASASAESPSAAAPSAPSRLPLPAVKAAVAALLGATGLYAVGALLASTAGLLFVAGLTGAAVGLVLARAAVPGNVAAPALTRRQVRWLAIALSIGAIAAGAVATWLNALGEGGTLGFVDYQLETFGPFIPGEVVIATVAAAWGASAGPVVG